MARILIVGGGFAGYSTLKTLHTLGVTGKHEVVLIDPSPHFVYLPSLPYLLSGKKTVEDLTVSFNEIANRLGSRHVKDAVKLVDAEKKEVLLEKSGALSYDKLIVCAGAQPEYYGVPGAESAMPAWRLSHYLRLMERLESGVRKVIVVGGGLTGIEVAGELLERLGPGTVTVVEKMSGLLPTLRCEKASRIAERHLSESGAELILGNGVSGVEGGRVVTLEDGRKLEGDAVIWTVGIRASSIPFRPEPERRGRGWLVVDKYMRVKGVEDVYAAGDAALFSLDDVYACKMAEEAILQGKTAARNVAAELEGEKASATHEPIFRSNRPRTLLSTGFNRGIAVWDRLLFDGSLPYRAKMLIEAAVMRDIRGRPLGGLLSGMEMAFIKTLDKLL